MLTVYGACAVTFMMVMYALERRGSAFVLAFAFGCALSSSYGFLAGTWPFGVVEAIWSLVALKRYADARRASVAPQLEAALLQPGPAHRRERATAAGPAGRASDVGDHGPITPS